jgi:general secretion pathway protein G
MMKANSGFTLIELVITLGIVAMLSTIVMPMAQVARQRIQEQELRRSLHEIRTAIDAYKQASDDGRIEKKIRC